MTKQNGKQRRKKRSRKQRLQMLGALVLVVGALVAAALLAVYFSSSEEDQGVTVAVTPATLSPEAVEGEVLFNANCAECHGPNAAGSDQGPPLIHEIYNPGHHSDESFYLAVAVGSRAHHWPYGDMPAQEQVSRDEATLIIKYIRELQEANGIVTRSYGG